MKTKGAIVRGPGQDWQIEEIELGDPIHGEVQVRLAASGMCHSDRHLQHGDFPVEFPAIGGHEGAGIVTKVGPGVDFLKEGDRVITAFIPACGKCRPCSAGLQNLCDKGASLLTGRSISDDTFRVTTAAGEGLVSMCLLGTFSPYITVNEASLMKIDDDIPLKVAALLGCGVATGWGSATEIGGTKVGDTVVVQGVGGVGINSIQGAAAAGARFVVAVDPVEFKRAKALELGATHAFASMEEAMEPVREMTWGQMANVTIITVGVILGEMIQPAMSMTGKGGQVVAVGMGPAAHNDVALSLFEMTLLQKNLQGAIFGGTGPRIQVPQLFEHYRSGALKLEELVTNTYRLEDVNKGYEDMMAGKNLRGVIEFTDEDY